MLPSEVVHAFESGDLRALHTYLLSGGSLDEVDADGDGLLHKAILFDSESAVEWLLGNGADPCVFNRRGKPPLVDAIMLCRLRCVQLLIQHKGDKCRPTGEQSYSPIHWAASKGSARMCREIANGSSDIHGLTAAGENAVAIASANAHNDAVRELLALGVSACHPDSEGVLPIHWAAQTGNIELLEILIEHGADIEARTSLGRTPFYLAVMCGSAAIARQLRAIGSVVNAVDDEGVAPIFWARFRGDTELIELCKE